MCASGTPGLAYGDPDRYVALALNTMLGGSMSSRLFQNVREKRGLAYSVFSSLSAYRDAGAVTIYAGCANDAVSELIDVVVSELRRMKADPLAAGELQRAKDHLKGSLMLGLESTSSRMSHLARQDIYGDIRRIARRHARRHRRGHRGGGVARSPTACSRRGAWA